MTERSESTPYSSRLREQALTLQRPSVLNEGKLTRMVGLTLEASGCQASVGTRCQVKAPDRTIDTEVVGFTKDNLLLMPVDDTRGMLPGSRVMPTNRSFDISVGDGLLGRVIDGAGEPIDGLGPLNLTTRRSIYSEPINPLKRTLISEALDVGVCSINGVLTIGRGQRIGLIAGSGVGKSQLLGMMTRNTDADVIVIGMIGERGREVKAFIDQILGPEGRARTVVIAVPADNTAIRRLHGAMLATTVAEYFRDRGRHVLMLVDSLTRFAQAQREIGLAVGEPPTTKGYPPSVFQMLPQLVERAGYADGGGSVTAIYTVLAENDDSGDPVVDAARAILDGHIVLSRDIAESGIYPAIDIQASVSRLVGDLADDQQLQHIQIFRKIVTVYRQNEELINLGVYQSGTNIEIDTVIRLWPSVLQYLRQDLKAAVSRAESLAQLAKIALEFQSAVNIT